MRTELEDLHRAEWTRIVASLARVFRSLDIAEEATQEAFAAALERWPKEGTPERPAAWLHTVARNRATDRVRRESTRSPRQEAAQELLRARASADLPDTGAVADDRLRLVFTCCHPALAPDARIALTLRLVAGLSTSEIARAFLVSDATLAQRLVRAKRKIATAQIPYRVPASHELTDRLEGVLRVIYLVFREGYSPSGGEDIVRVDLCEEAIRLARLVVELLPDEGEAVGLLALLLLHHSRHRARLDEAGELVLLANQDRRTWDHDLIAEGAGLAVESLRRGRRSMALQAAIAAAHATADSPSSVPWARIAGLYRELAILDPSPAVRLSGAVARGEAEGPAAGLREVDALLATESGAALAAKSHHPHVARAELLRRLGRAGEAAQCYRDALSRSPTEPERRHLRARLAALDGPADGPAGGPF